jgi:lipoteichoic acid synthase
LRRLLSRREWTYLLSLLVPFTVYNLALKASDVASQPGVGDHWLARSPDLMRSDVFFNLGYALLWIGLFAAIRRGPLRWAVVFLFHVVTMLVVIVTTCAHQYFKDNGTTLDYAIIAEWIPKFNEIVPILVDGVPLSAWVVLASALLYAALGPWFLTRAVEWWRGRPESYRAETPGISVLGPLGLWFLALAFVSLSVLLVGSGPTAGGAGKSVARAPFVNVVLTGVQEATAEEHTLDTDDADPINAVANASLVPSPGTEKRNVVLVHLESTRERSVTPYNEQLNTTPFLNELAKSSLLVERSYAVVPRSSKATVAVNCGVDPPLYQGPEFEPGGIPARCLPHLLKDQGYRTAFFQSSSETMDEYSGMAENLGFEEYYPSESMATEGFEATNYISYEDDIMLEPSEEWLKENGNEPFFIEYLTGTGHDDYRCLGTRHGSEDFAEDELLNKYLNCLRLQDIFLESLFDQYEELGLYEDTIFVIFGDHGEGFGEHGRYVHGDTIYEEGLRVPLLIHDPKRFQNGERVEELSNQTDILPTVVDMLGYKVDNGEYPGYSLLRPLPEERTLMFNCVTERKCLASIKGYDKYVYHYDDQPDEVFDLSKDPLEKRNLTSQRTEKELDERREELLAWRSRINAGYGGRASSATMNPK